MICTWAKRSLTDKLVTKALQLYLGLTIDDRNRNVNKMAKNVTFVTFLLQKNRA